MQVHRSEGVANHTGPEPCVGIREDAGEASVGDGIGQPLSRDSSYTSGADAVQLAEGNMTGRVFASAQLARRGRRPWHVSTLLVREPGDLQSGHKRFKRRRGPHREGDEPKPMMYGPQKSDLAIVAVKLANKAEVFVAESVEPRAGAKGNTGQSRTHRTQRRG